MTGCEKSWSIYTGKGLARKYIRAKPFPSNFSQIHTSYLPAYEDGTECSETSAYKIQTPGNYPEESIQYIRICQQQYKNMPNKGTCV